MEIKTFAFKLADKALNSCPKWKAREGISIAGCTQLSENDYRDFRKFGDDGYHC